MTKTISIVIPVFNSATAVQKVYAAIEKALSTSGYNYHVILVDDGSEDNSWEAVKAVKNQYPDTVTAVRMSKNYGQHNAIFVGFRQAKGDYVITIDDDLQHPPDQIPDLIKCAEETGADLVYGTSPNYKRSLKRKILRWGYRTLNRMTASNDNNGSSFRLMRKELVAKLIHHDQEFVFIDELSTWYTAKIAYVKVRHDPSILVKSRYPFSRLSRLYYNLVFGYNAFLLRMITFLGCTASAMSFLVGLYFIIKKLFFHVQVGFTGIVVSITFTGGIILLSIGIIGEYMRRMYNIMNEKPQSSISEILE